MTKLSKILLVEDEESLINVLCLNFELENYQVIVARDGEEALNLFSIDIDLVVLDIMIPKINGFDVCTKIREQSDVPILIVSAKGTSTDRITGLKIGANDYLVKPFDLEELLLRVNNLVTRNVKRLDTVLESFEFGSNKIDFLDYSCFSKGKYLKLSDKETRLLKFLIEHRERVVSRDEILDNVWGEESFPTSRTIDNYIVNFRKYFEKNPKQPIHFTNVRGVGYKFQE